MKSSSMAQYGVGKELTSPMARESVADYYVTPVITSTMLC